VAYERVQPTYVSLNINTRSYLNVRDQGSQSPKGTGKITVQYMLELRHPRCVCDMKVQCKVVKNTTSLLSVNSVVNRTTCFGRLGGHHQVQ
jgi:hypothetical protein